LIPYGRQSISEADIQAVVDVLKSDFLTQGPMVPAFEDAVAAVCGAKFGVAMNSATSALHVACLALGVGPGDSVWTSPLTFVASSNAALYCGADVDFVDVDERTYNMCPARLAAKLDHAAEEGKLPKVIIPVHLTGQSCDMAAIHAAASRHGVRIIEDASHAIGGSYQALPVGNCRYSDITIFSFHPVKIVTTGEGGMAMTNDPELAERMRLDRSHGITRDPAKLQHDDAGAWYYEQQRLGFNYRMTDICAALGLSQMARIDRFLARRAPFVSRTVIVIVAEKSAVRGGRREGGEVPGVGRLEARLDDVDDGGGRQPRRGHHAGRDRRAQPEAVDDPPLPRLRLLGACRR